MQSSNSEWQQEKAHRSRQRTAGYGNQSAAETICRRSENDEKLEQGNNAAHDAEHEIPSNVAFSEM